MVSSAAVFLELAPIRLLSAGLKHGENYVLELEDLTGSDEIDGVGDRTDLVWIEQISAFPQGAGVGRRVMSVLTSLADELGVTLMHNPWAQRWGETTGGLPQDQLEAWYNRLGYRWIRDKNYHIMGRDPRRVSPENP